MSAATAEAPDVKAQPKAKAPRLTAKVKREIVAKRQAGTTLAELRKAYPDLTSEQIREVLAAAEPAATAQGYSGSGATVADPPKRTPGKAKTEPEPAAKAAAKAKAERKPIDPKVAAKAVNMRGKLNGQGRPTSWAKIGFALKLVPEGVPKSQAGDAARRAYRQVRGDNAPTGPSDY
jgi:hypothetical protein